MAAALFLLLLGPKLERLIVKRGLRVVDGAAGDDPMREEVAGGDRG